METWWIGKNTDSVEASAFGSPGIFTTWMVASSSAEWGMLNASGFVGAYLEFFDMNYAFFE
ncbi:hypothetical protein PHLCEN_2v1824 [Hermanssonia centrifuga]|uniref:Uncharacterized protein n=1 Tax=Hermanssonia centrifuga TaxID=98765 RepID=A0A2R6RVR9_9APHY|nr:hypothetical protein PHLCEN_2v13338 [Hermanssonia centrifuga]PSS34114.1 hypothetical protein PHLCEN_2v1824 [Hermanssonia centrifuga]